ncbi:DUF2662 domain-containing protein [Coriobacteriales bacterium OH1046]|nr:DUF2662 domain-containing protein [Coriobacteriales bacterium OH1046]
MSFLSDFESRIAALFETAPQGYVEPFSFKKLAKHAAKEMENETYEIDGIDTAPALYTVLVSSVDDGLMRPLYASITDEISTFIASQANKRGYVFVGRPLVRFMVDPALKSGRFAVFAENIDASTLSRLHKEEKDFLAGNARVGGAAAQSGVAPIPAPSSAPDPLPLGSIIADDGSDVLAEDAADDLPPLSPLDFAAAPQIPQTRRRVSAIDVPAAAPAAPEAVPAPRQAPAATALLIDRQTGRTFPLAAPSAIIGRERSQSTVVLTDPNISRRHAEITYDGRSWHIIDLRSTNGTLVNDVDVDECILRDGDLITVGLTNLEFRES